MNEKRVKNRRLRRKIRGRLAVKNHFLLTSSLKRDHSIHIHTHTHTHRVSLPQALPHLLSDKWQQGNLMIIEVVSSEITP